MVTYTTQNLLIDSNVNWSADGAFKHTRCFIRDDTARKAPLSLSLSLSHTHTRTHTHTHTFFFLSFFSLSLFSLSPFLSVSPSLFPLSPSSLSVSPKVALPDSLSAHSPRARCSRSPTPHPHPHLHHQPLLAPPPSLPLPRFLIPLAFFSVTSCRHVSGCCYRACRLVSGRLFFSAIVSLAYFSLYSCRAVGIGPGPGPDSGQCFTGITAAFDVCAGRCGRRACRSGRGRRRPSPRPRGASCGRLSFIVINNNNNNNRDVIA